MRLHLVWAAAILTTGLSCGNDSNGRNTGDDGIASLGTSGVEGTTGDSTSATTGIKLDVVEPTGGPATCENLQCQQVICDDADVTTTVTGTIYDPSGTLPIYNVVVYVPNAEVEPIPDGLTCDQCDTEPSGSPLVTALTDTRGQFELENVPVGDDIPLVIQIGKWRRQVTIPQVQPCQENPLVDTDMTRLPRSRAEGNLPRIALTTGNADPLFCLLRRLGIEDSEYGITGSDARVHFYHGARDGAPGSVQYDEGFGASPGAMFPPGDTTLWTDGWENYDIVLLSCEGSALPNDNDGHRVNLRDYIDHGGRVFATHFHYTWMVPDTEDARVQAELADLASVATFGSNQDGDLYDGGTLYIDTSFPKGMALADWLVFVDGSSPHGEFSAREGRAHTRTLDEDLARLWVTHDLDGEDIPIYFSFNAPIPAEPEEQCGRMVFSDIHVSSGAGSATAPFPSACDPDAPLTEQEKVLIFMLFDLFACIQPDDDPVIPPPPA